LLCEFGRPAKMRVRDGPVTGIVPARFGSSLSTRGHDSAKRPAVFRWWNVAGGDKRLDTCFSRFANVLNFRREPYVPGQDRLMSYPDAR
jgi:hypothetical protein